MTIERLKSLGPYQGLKAWSISGPIGQDLKNIARDSARGKNRIDTFFVYELTKSKDYKVEEEDKLTAYEFPDSQFALGLSMNPNLVITEADKSVVRSERLFDSEYVKSLVQRSDYVVDQSDKYFAREHYWSIVAFELARNSTYQIDASDLNFMKKCPTSNFSLGLKQNPNYKAALEHFTPTNPSIDVGDVHLVYRAFHALKRFFS